MTTKTVNVVPLGGVALNREVRAIAAYSDAHAEDRPKVRAEKTLNKQIIEMLMIDNPNTRRARVMTVIELIGSRVAEAYELNGQSA